MTPDGGRHFSACLTDQIYCEYARMESKFAREASLGRCVRAGIDVRLAAGGIIAARSRCRPFPSAAQLTFTQEACLGGWRKVATAEITVRLTDQTLSCAAKALVTTAERHAACLHLKCAMQTA